MHELPYTAQDTNPTPSNRPSPSSEHSPPSHPRTPPPSYSSSEDHNHTRRFGLDLPSPPLLPQTPLPSYTSGDYGLAQSTRRQTQSPYSQRLNMALNIVTSPSDSLTNISPVRTRTYRQPVDPCRAMVWMVIASVVLGTVVGVLVWVLA